MEFNKSKQELTKSNTTLQNEGGDENKKGFGLGLRHVQALLLFFCFFETFFLRINLSVGIVSMTNKNSSNPDFHVKDGSNEEKKLSYLKETHSLENSSVPQRKKYYFFEEFGWTENQKSAILSSFFWGYLVIQAPAGQLGQYFSPKLLLLGANLISAVLAGLTPTASYVGGWKLLCALRVIQGLCQGFAVPLSYKLISKWAPPNERNRYVGFSLNGGTLGATAAMPLCGLLASSSGGWPSIFYFSGLLGITWCALWAWFAADSPAKHHSISPEEKAYIENSLVHVSQDEEPKTPWSQIFTSIPFWALIFAHLGNGWAFAMIITEMPSYINSVLQFNIATNGILSALPYLAMWLLTFPVCWLADYLQKNKIVPNSVVRKLWTTIAQSGGAIMLVSMGFVGRDAVAAMTLLIITVALASFLFSGYNINHLDLSPNYAGVLMGIANGLENITTILAPLTVGWVVEDTRSVEQWRIVFIISAIVSITGNTIFVLFGSTDIQPWNTIDQKPKKNENNQSIP
ncbi:putative inorganic phosphate cotransporter isoform X2 [Halyomorpha halys]